jgi:cyclophilin family peptidyl-prolyl cis-trans isomerase
VTKKRHDKEVARARAKRRASVQQRRERRNRVIVLAMVVLMAFSLIGGAVLSMTRDPASPPPADEATDAATDAQAEQATDDAAAETTEEPAEEEAVGPCGPTPDDVPEIASATYDEPFELSIDPDATYVATFETTCGDIVVELEAAAAPLTVNNLVGLAEDGYYDGIVFHRVIQGFMAQVGDPTGTGAGGPGYTFEDELDRAEEVFAAVQEEQRDELGDDADESLPVPGGYPRGTVAMANAGPDTNGSQLFFSQGDPTLLPGPDYTVFGTVVEGMEVVDDIVASPTDASDRPLADVAIRTVTIEQS